MLKATLALVGLLFAQQTPASLIEAVRRFQSITFNTEDITRHAARFSRARFAREISTFVTSCLEAGPIRGRELGEASPSWN